MYIIGIATILIVLALELNSLFDQIYGFEIQYPIDAEYNF